MKIKLSFNLILDSRACCLGFMLMLLGDHLNEFWGTSK
jgi:hypothetical protein